MDVHVVETVMGMGTGMGTGMEPVDLLPRVVNWWSLSRRPMVERYAAGLSRMAV